MVWNAWRRMGLTFLAYFQNPGSFVSPRASPQIT
jgi:hypothetical protein